MSLPTDPHADIQALCDALATAVMLLVQEEIMSVPAPDATAINHRIGAMHGGDPAEIMRTGIEILMRSRLVH